jgi:RHS repeat-associated protein
LDRVTSMLWRLGPAAPFGTWAYAHNERGQRLTSTDITGRAAAYTYDSAARLATESISGDPRGAGLNGGLSYVLDAVGNRTSRTSTVAALGAQSFTYNANDEISGDTFDANGNTTASGGHTYAYDFENRLVSNDTGAVTIAYDCDGNRVAKTVGGVTTRYLVDDLNPTGYLQVFEEVVGGTVQTRYTYGDRIVSQTRDVSTMPATSYYGFDAHENITFLTDATGTVTASYDYDAWGNLVASTGSTPNSRFYAGEELDADLGLINLRARQYRPDVGRFLTIDPVLGTLQNPISLNTHLYANGDSVNLVDPHGTMAMVERGLLVPFQERLVQIAAVGLAAALCGYYHAISALDPGIEVPFCRASDLTKKRRRYWDDWFRNQEQLPVPNGRCWPEFIACMAFCDPDSPDAYVGWHRLTCLEQFKACVRNGGG